MAEHKQDKKTTILIVEDNPANCKVLSDTLADAGDFRILIAQNGVKGVQIAHKALPDLILLDINMPEMDGYEVCERLKGDPATQHIPIIFLSAMTDVRVKVRCFALGASDYISKPFHRDEIIKRVEVQLKVLNLQRQVLDQNESLKKKNDELQQFTARLEQLVWERTQELETALNDLNKSQEQLMLVEKTSTFSKILASLAHEMNSPLGAINASNRNVQDTYPDIIRDFPMLLDKLTADELSMFEDLLAHILNNKQALDSRQRRELVKEYAAVLQEHGHDDGRHAAQLLVDAGCRLPLVPFIPLLGSRAGGDVLNLMAKIGQIQVNLLNVSEASRRTKKIIFNLQTFSDGPIALQGERPVELRQSLLDCMKLYETSSRNVELHWQLPNEPVWISANPDMLEQIWSNLIANALHAMNYEGNLEIQLILAQNFAEIILVDSGHGIALEIQDRVFEPFFTTKSQGEGYGLGLDICRKVVERLGGEIGFESEPGRTAFRVRLPLQVGAGLPRASLQLVN